MIVTGMNLKREVDMDSVLNDAFAKPGLDPGSFAFPPLFPGPTLYKGVYTLLKYVPMDLGALQEVNALSIIKSLSMCTSGVSCTPSRREVRVRRVSLALCVVVLRRTRCTLHVCT